MIDIIKCPLTLIPNKIVTVLQCMKNATLCDTLWCVFWSSVNFIMSQYWTCVARRSKLSLFIWSAEWWVKSWKRLLSRVITPFRYFTQHWHANSLFSPSNSPQLLPKMNCIHNPNYEKSLPFVSKNSFFLLKILNQVINGSRSRWAGARNSHTKRIFTDWSIFSISFLL